MVMPGTGGPIALMHRFPDSGPNRMIMAGEILPFRYRRHTYSVRAAGATDIVLSGRRPRPIEVRSSRDQEMAGRGKRSEMPLPDVMPDG